MDFSEEFVEVMSNTELHDRIPFDMDSPFIQLYFGRDKKRLVSYSEFSQFLHDFHEEYAIEGFRRADKSGTGFISVLDFQFIMTNIKSHLLTKQVQSHLIEVIILPLFLHSYCIFIVNKMVMKKQRYMYIFLFFFSIIRQPKDPKAVRGSAFPISLHLIRY